MENEFQWIIDERAQDAAAAIGRQKRRRVMGILVMAGFIGTVAYVMAQRRQGEVWRYAPEGAAMVIHIDMEAAWPEVSAAFREQAGGEGQRFQAIEPMVTKCRTMDLFAMGGAKTARGIKGVAVLRGKLSVDDVRAFLKASNRPSLSLKEAGQGRYEVAGDPDGTVLLFGGQCPGVGKGVVLVGPGSWLTQEVVDRLGEGDHSRLRKLAGKADQKAAIWMAMDMKEYDVAIPWLGRLPVRELAASMELSGDRRWQYHLEFENEAAAARTFPKDMKDAWRGYAKVTAERKGAAVRVEMTPSAGMMRDLLRQAAGTAVLAVGSEAGGPGQGIVKQQADRAAVWQRALGQAGPASRGAEWSAARNMATREAPAAARPKIPLPPSQPRLIPPPGEALGEDVAEILERGYECLAQGQTPGRNGGPLRALLEKAEALSPDTPELVRYRKIVMGPLGGVAGRLSAEEFKAQLAAIPSAPVVRLNGTTVNDLGPLAARGDIEVLQLDDLPGLRDLSPLAGMSGLRILHLSRLPRVEDLSAVGMLPNLEMLAISQCESVTVLPEMRGLKKLRMVQVVECPGLAVFARLERASGLRTLDLRRCPLPEDPQTLARMPWLETIRISGYRGKRLPPLAGPGSKLRRLAISECPAIERIEPGGMENLEWAELYGVRGLKDVSFVGGSPRLRVFVLQGAWQVKDLSPLAKAEGLAYASFVECPKLTGAMPLAGMKKLRFLGFQRVSDEFKKDLAGLSKGLPGVRFYHQEPR